MWRSLGFLSGAGHTGSPVSLNARIFSTLVHLQSLTFTNTSLKLWAPICPHCVIHILVLAIARTHTHTHRSPRVQYRFTQQETMNNEERAVCSRTNPFRTQSWRVKWGSHVCGWHVWDKSVTQLQEMTRLSLPSWRKSLIKTASHSALQPVWHEHFQD